MAFIHPALPLRRTASTSQRCTAARRATWTCLAKSHPYGNGGLNNVADFTGYDPGKLAEEAAFAEAKLLGEKEDAGVWALVMSADVIQWNNNLYETSFKNGYNWDLAGVSVIRLSEGAARRAIDSNTSELFVVMADAECVLAVGTDDNAERMVLSFEKVDEAVRFVDNLKADGNDHASFRKISIEELKQICEQAELLIGVVPEKALLVPSQFRADW